MDLLQQHHRFARELARFIEFQFRDKLGNPEDWWESHVLNNLSIGQRGQVRSRGIERLGQLDLHALLRIFDRNWEEIRHWCRLSNNVRTYLKGISDQRNDYSHQAAEGYEVDPANLYRDADTLFRSASALNLSDTLLDDLSDFRKAALVKLAASEFPNRIKASCADKFELVLEEKTQPYVPQPQAATRPSSVDPSARVFSHYRIHGPEESLVTEIKSFKGNPVPATEIPWRVTGVGGLELKVHICLIDDPDEYEIGQVFCDTRLNSPPAWDQVVRRLRTGIRRLDNGSLFMDLRLATTNGSNQATRRSRNLKEVDKIIGFSLKEELVRVGALDVGTREQLDANPNRQMRNSPCVLFDQDDIFTPVAAWVATTVAPLQKELR